MAVCLSCGKSARAGAAFCTACGARLPVVPEKPAESASAAHVPLITLAPESARFDRRRMKSLLGYVAGLVGVIALALGVVFISAWTQNNSFSQNTFAETDVRTDVHDRCLALVRDVRSENLDEIIGDVNKSKGVAKDYDFTGDMKSSFKEILGDNPTEMEEIFARCCYQVAFTEYWAKLYQYDTQKIIIGGLFKDKANKYRRYADQLWEMLNNAETISELESIIEFCDKNDIISREDNPLA